MLVIRQAQIDALSAALSQRFEERMVAHLWEVVPEDCEALGDEEVRRSIQTCLRKAREYRISTAFDILRYLNVMYVLGLDFDTDPRFPWARELLLDFGISPRVRMDRLVRRTHEALAAREASER